MATFLSYSSRNQEQAARLAEILRNFDKDVFVEQKTLGGSISWEQAFSKIKNCDLFVLALTQYSLNSYARKLETDYAAALKKPTLVVLLEDVGELPPELSTAAKVLFKENYEPSLTVFSDAIRQVLPPQEVLTDAQPPSWSTALTEVQQRLQMPNMPLYEQRRLATSLRDLLERRESFAPTLGLLKQTFSARTSDTQLIEEFGYLLEDAQLKARWGGPLRLLLIGLPLLVIAGLAVVLLPRLLSSSGEQETPTAVSLAQTATPTETMVIAGADTATSTEVITATPSATPTITLTPTDTPIPPTVTLVQAFFPTRSRTPTLSATATLLTSDTPLPTVTATDLPTEVAAAIPTETATETAAPTETAISTETATTTTIPSETPTVTPSSTETPLPTDTATATATATETATITTTPLPTNTTTATETPVPTVTATFTETPLPTITPTATLLTSVYVGLRVADSEAGVRVAEVGASAQLSGVRVDDIVEAVDDVPVATVLEFANEMNARRPSEVVTLRLRRSGGLVFATISLSITDFAAPTATPQFTASATATP